MVHTYTGLISLCVVYVAYNLHPCSILEVLRLIVEIQLERRDQRKGNIGSTLTRQMEDMSLRYVSTWCFMYGAVMVEQVRTEISESIGRLSM